MRPTGETSWQRCPGMTPHSKRPNPIDTSIASVAHHTKWFLLNPSYPGSGENWLTGYAQPAATQRLNASVLSLIVTPTTRPVPTLTHDRMSTSARRATMGGMEIDSGPVEVLSEDACWEALLSTSLGRLGVSVGGEPDIFPINFVTADRKVYFRSAEGTKLLALVVNQKVALEADGVGNDQAWSVVIKGTARIIEKQSEIDSINELPLTPLIPTLKYIFVEIDPTEITGRRFNLGPEPERY